MGYSYLSDFISGKTLREGEDVVAIVIAERSNQDSYQPTQLGIPAGSSNQAFVAASLPIHAKAGEYGNIEPFYDQLSLRLLLEMTGRHNWSEFVNAMQDESAPLIGQAGKPLILGLAIVSDQTWQSVLNTQPWHLPRKHYPSCATAVDSVLSALKNAQAAGQKSGNLSVRKEAIITLDAHIYDGEVSPELASALSYNNQETALHWELIGTAKSYLWEHVTNGGKLEEITEILFALWDHQAFHKGLDILNRQLMPSRSAGQEMSHESVADLSMQHFRESFRGAVEMAEDGGDLDRLERLREKAAMFKAMASSLVEEITEIEARFPHLRR